MDTIVLSLPRRGKIVCFVLSQSLILICCVMLFRGTWLQHEVNATTMAPVTEIPMIWVFGVSYVTALGIGLQALIKLWRVATGRIRDDELIDVSEDEEIHPVPATREAGR
jgi:TRAP-type C4-dicarboxylate transport system permease small subunit